MLKESWLDGRRLVMLEPRRLAARRSAEYMASLLGEHVGKTVGYRIRGETRVGNTTRIEVVTEGVLTRMLHDRPDLPGVALVVFDEFHERNIHADLGLALCLDVQAHLRSDLRILVMSATLDEGRVSEFLGGAPVVQSTGRSFPVETRYLSFPYDGPVEKKVVEVIRRALGEEEGDVLVFLPGQREINRVQGLLGEKDSADDVSICTLHGDASYESQQSALSPSSPGQRKVILSTSIAETSLTIDGVRVVVDAGLARSTRFDPRRGMSGLVTLPVSKAAADQRRGRAGRQQPGVCYRLWTQEQHDLLQAAPLPEILTTDLAPLVLDLSLWGARDGTSLRFLDRPPDAHLRQATNLLRSLGAIDADGMLTRHGRDMAGIPVHPRLAHMIVRGNELDLGALACEVAALLEDRDILRGHGKIDVDFMLRLDALRSGTDADDTTRSRVLGETKRLQHYAGTSREGSGSATEVAILIAIAYPERVARRRRGKEIRYQMTGGTGAVLPAWSSLGREEFLAVADVDGMGTEARVFLAASLRKADILDVFADQITSNEEVFWDAKTEAVVARRISLLDQLVIAEQDNISTVKNAAVAMMQGIRQMGLASLPWDNAAESFRARSEWLRRQDLVDQSWPDLSDTHLLDTLEVWLQPFLNGITRRSHLARLNMLEIIRSPFSFSGQKELDRLAPARFRVPTGSQIGLDYSSGAQPVLAVKLQEMFGQTTTPTIAAGRVPLLINLLSPAGRPLAVTQDLRSFWTNVYPEVRKRMRGRYPKHPWPEDPLEAVPTKKTKRLQSQ
jgi:ATP-dependent helicase HrpB